MQETSMKFYEYRCDYIKLEWINAKSQLGLAAPGRIIHEVGTIRMMDDPKRGH